MEQNKKQKDKKEKSDKSDKSDISLLYEKYYGDKKDKKESKTDSNKGKKGYKYCPCNNYVPARAKTCEYCNKVFTLGETYEPPKILSEEEQVEQKYIDRVNLTGKIVYTASGPCPIQLDGHTRETVYDWCDAILEDGVRNRRILFPSVMIGYLTEYYSIDSPEHKKVKKFIKQWAENYELE